MTRTSGWQQRLSRGGVVKIFIPTVGTKMMVLSPWKMRLYPEKRNKTLYEAYDLQFPRMQLYPLLEYGQDIVVPAMSDLEVVRVFIRSTSPQYDSVTFKGHVPIRNPQLCQCHLVGHSYRRVRFWARLKDVNKLEVTIV